MFSIVNHVFSADLYINNFRKAIIFSPPMKRTLASQNSLLLFSKNSKVFTRLYVYYMRSALQPISMNSINSNLIIASLSLHAISVTHTPNLRSTLSLETKENWIPRTGGCFLLGYRIEEAVTPSNIPPQSTETRYSKCWNHNSFKFCVAFPFGFEMKLKLEKI